MHAKQAFYQVNYILSPQRYILHRASELVELHPNKLPFSSDRGPNNVLIPLDFG